MFTCLKQVFLVLLLVVACDGSCPKKCTCTPFASRVIVKCRNVKQVPRDIPSNTALLNLSGASLSSVQEESFRKLKSLHLIDLSNNSLKFIPKNTFRNLTSLQVINLNGNRIQGGFYLPEGVHKIEMRGNFFSLRDLKIILNGLTRLYFLDVSNNGIGPNLTSDVFTGCDDMEYLAMEGCHLENIESGTFRAMKKLSRLDFNSNLLTSVPDLSGLTNIYFLKLQGNHIKNIIQLGTAFHIKRLLTLSLADNQIDNLPASVFQIVAVYWYIDLSFNKLQSIPDKAFYACGDLRELYLHFNKISHISRHSFTGLVNLTKLFLHGNAIKHIDGKGFHNLTNLQILTLFSNPLTKLSACWII
ncbi:decorin-like [Oculina patagonica]